VRDIGSVAQVSTAWRRIVTETPELYEIPLHAEISAVEMTDAHNALISLGSAYLSDARVLYITCWLGRTQLQLNR
jgi:hypothetical protein